MPTLDAVIGCENVRDLNIFFFEDPDAAYLRSGPHGHLTRRQVLQKIHNVQDSKVRRNLREITNFSRDTIKAAWSHHLAVNAGTHLWPDANHRTAMWAFGMAAIIEFEVDVYLEVDMAREMTKRSKTIRDTDFLSRGSRYYTVAELRGSGHPYRKLFAEYEAHLIVEDLADVAEWSFDEPLGA